MTRHSMQEHREGETYDGRYIVADVKLGLSCPPECGRVIVGPTGFGLLSRLPDDRWLIFVNRDEADTRRELPTLSAPAARLCILKYETQRRSLNPTSTPTRALSNAPNSAAGRADWTDDRRRSVERR